ncbi:hypothetical protein [Rhodococcoides yunnanense]|uniref:hypothetical protein n=1 Tax=Rhodococcoides yunnanense TaxID=278209 RepID=UPI0009355814|nr:hypothetical protein [Rhodococcus yunnanensis]
MKFGQMVLGLVPWILFAILTQRFGDNQVAFAALISAIAAVGIAYYQRSGGIKIIEASAVVLFAAIAVVGFVGGESVDDFLADFARGGTTLVLAAVMLVSVVTVPFTEQYARESVDREYWDSPKFHSTNRKISLFWGATLLVMGVGHLVAGALQPLSDPGEGTRSVDLLLNWIVPIVLLVIAVKYTQRTAAAARTAVT